MGKLTVSMGDLRFMTSEDFDNITEQLQEYFTEEQVNTAKAIIRNNTSENFVEAE